MTTATSPPEATAGEDTRRRWVPGSVQLGVRQLGWSVLTLLALFVSMAANGRLPGLTSGLLSNLVVEGEVGCQAHHLFSVACPDLGLPVGEYTANGLTTNFLSALPAELPFIDVHLAIVISSALFFLVSFWGTVGLTRRFGATYLVGLIAGCLYTISPTIIGLSGFGSTLWGFVMLPAFIELDLRIYDRWQTSAWRLRALLLVGWAVAKAALLLTDGYSFVVCAVIAGLTLLVWTVARRASIAALTSLVGFAVANGFAYLTYHHLLSKGADLTKTAQPLFRAMGVDLTSLYRPSGLWWLGNHNQALKLSTLWGDTSNSLWNYIGLGCALLAVVGLALSRRNRLMLPFVLGLFITGLLSLGPTLKIDDHRVPPLPGQAENVYNMPVSAAQASLPTAPLFEKAPGVDIMRATYRWYGGTRLLIIVFAAAAVSELAARSRGRARGDLARRSAVVLVGVVAVLELVPSPGALRHLYRLNDAARRQIDGVAGELRTAVGPGKKVAFVSLIPNSFPNDYLAPYLATESSLRATNLAGDKSVRATLGSWAPPIKRLMLGVDVRNATEAALSQGLVDAVVVPHFDIRLSTASWPSASFYTATGTRLSASLAKDPKLAVVNFAHFSVVKLVGG
jgi:hypothetical protein